MKAYYRLKRVLKLGRLRLRRYQALRRWGRDALQHSPRVFGNSMPKAGSHLLIQILWGLTEVGPFINPGFPPVNRFEDNSHLSNEVILKSIQRMRSGEIRFGYIGCNEPFISALTNPDWATINIYRDPRDLLVSSIFYALNIHLEHGMHKYYAEELSTMEERLNVEINGIHKPNLVFSGIRARYDNHLSWIENSHVLSLKFEDIILNTGETLGRLADYITGFGVQFPMPRTEVIQTLTNAIRPKESGTFRKGQPGNWREHFTDENKEQFKAAAGDLLIKLGYEENNDW